MKNTLLLSAALALLALPIQAQQKSKAFQLHSTTTKKESPVNQVQKRSLSEDRPPAYSSVAVGSRFCRFFIF